MADPKISNAAALAACNAIVDRLDAGAGAGTLKIYAGSVPANVEAAAGTLLATLTLSDPAFGDAVDINPGARATANAITSDSSADATGTAAYFRASDSDGTSSIQGTVTATGGGGDLEVGTVSFVAGAVISVTSWTVTVPEG